MKPFLILLVLIPLIVPLYAEATIIPKVKELRSSKGVFTLQDELNIILKAEGKQLTRLQQDIELFTQFVQNGLNIESTVSSNAPSKKNALHIHIKPRSLKGLAKDAYQLDINTNGIFILAANNEGAYYALQSLKQLLPPSTFSAKPLSSEDIAVSAVSIKDAPRFPYRGFMLDSCRHMQPISKIKQYLDLMALYKMNVFHWHLTEDEAWRMEIKKYPKLTSVGAYPGDKTKEEELNGYYTQEQMREIVQYANARHIKVIPEFDIPGHTNALLITYPEYSCKGEPLPMGEHGLRAFSSKAGRRALCAGKHETVIPMVLDIFEEMKSVFTDGIFHIGGDERPRGNWENCQRCKAQIKKLGLKNEHYLQNWFLNEISEKLRKKGIRSMAWGEHMEGGIPKDQIVQAWLNASDLQQAVNANHQVVNSVNNHYYLDYPANDLELEKYAKWMRNSRVSTRSIYHTDPVPDNFNAKEEKLVVGIEAPVWTETILLDRLDKKVFPRLLAIAELGWTSKQGKDWTSFQKRFETHADILSALGIMYDKSDKISN